MNQPDSQRTPFTAIVLAGQRSAADPLVQRSNAGCKAMIEIDGKAMLQRVLDTLAASQQVDRRIISGPDLQQLDPQSAIRTLVDSGDVDWQAPQSSPSTSAWHAMQTVPAGTPILLTTADHPLLSAEIVDEFCRQSRVHDLDVAAGLAPYELVRQAFPDMKKTVMHFKEGDYCGCNLFTFMTPEGRDAARFWRKVEQERKNPFKVIRALGWASVLKYLLHRLTLREALDNLSNKLGVRAGTVLLPWAEAAVDVDSISDHDIVQRKMTSNRMNAPP